MPPKTYDHGLFITFEGPEGSGKTTQIKLLEERLKEEGYEVLTTREPGGTMLGEELRRLLMNFQEEEITAEAELMMFSASRVQHIKRVILPCLKRGGVVLCDRFIDSTTAYQGYARGLDMQFIRTLNDFAVCGRYPDLTIILDLDVEIGLARTRERYQGKTVNDRIEAESRAFHTAVRNGFLEIARKEPGRVKVFDANRPVELVQADVWWEVTHALG